MLRKFLIFAVSFLLVFGISAVSVSASENTTYTYTISVDNEWIRTQDAYMPGEVLFSGYGLSQPNDIFVLGRKLYVADTGNSRIVITDLDTKEKTFMGEGILSAPSGIFVKSDGTVYVADGTAKAVFILGADGSVLKKIERPENSPLFGSKSVFEPKNVAVTSQNNIFVVGTGAHEGIMQFSADGEFQGFFAANKRNLSLLERIQELTFSDEQKAQLLNRTSRPIENIDITERDLICSVSQDAGVTTEWAKAEKKVENRIKLHNMAGVNILGADEDLNDEWNFVDVAAGNHGNLYAVTYTGVISEYDSSGELLFSFGGRSMSSDRSGLFNVAAAIDVGDNGFLYVLDKERGTVQIFYPTAYAEMTHTAASVLEKGDYKDSEELWNSILNLNGMSRIAHIGYGKSLFHQQRFKEALNEFKIANDKEDYSDAFWEIRNQAFNNAVPYLLIAAAVIYIICKAAGIIRKKKNIKRKVKQNNYPRFLSDMLNIFDMLKHPIDNYYDIKHGTKGTAASATAVYLLLMLVFVADMLFRGYLFAPSLSNVSLLPVLIMLLVPLALWVLGNTMVASINDGEGSLKNIYTVTAYAVSPYIIITPFVVLLSYFVTYNEAFILQLIWFIGVAWSAVLLFLAVKQTHNYNVGETVKNILLTAFFMLMAVVAAAIMYVMWNSLVSFFSGVFGEVGFRVTG